MYQSPPETFPDSPSARAHAWLKRSLIALAALAVLITVLFVLWPTPTPTDVAEQYIENHYDAIAEDIAHLIMPDSHLKAEIAAEILESIAERAIPYSCLTAARQSESADPVRVDCVIIASVSTPIDARLILTIDPDRDSFKSKPQVLSARLDSEAITLSGLSIADARAAIAFLAGTEEHPPVRAPDVRTILETLNRTPTQTAEHPRVQQPDVRPTLQPFTPAPSDDVPSTNPPTQTPTAEQVDHRFEEKQRWCKPGHSTTSILLFTPNSSTSPPSTWTTSREPSGGIG